MCQRGKKVLISIEFQKVHLPIEDAELGPRAMKAHLCPQVFLSFIQRREATRTTPRRCFGLELTWLFTEHLQR